MRISTRVAAGIVLAGLAAPAPALAWGIPGCVNLPEYDRALGALQGMTSACDMSLERAHRIVAAQGNRPGGLFGLLLGGSPQPVPEAAPVPPSPPVPATRSRRHRAHRDGAALR